ncbi:MAG: YgiQ family radical SAM protein [Rectinemataceae bacterium]|jgi:uncharacterized radical SAM protein YgiQ
MPFLPALAPDFAAWGLNPGGLDAIFVTGDAYVDHASFGVALLGRLLEAEGYRVGVIARPDPDDVSAFRLLGRPRLAFLVTAGALDSMVSSYTANRKPRSEDDYAPGGRAELCLRGDGTIGKGVAGRTQARPDRAVIAYAAKAREAYKGVRVVVGGVEASLRSLAHYDYWSDKVRRSILLDSKADILVHGMGEQAVSEILGRLAAAALSGAVADLRGIAGTAWHASKPPELEPGSFILLPSYEESSSDKAAFLEATRVRYANADPHYAKALVERSDTRFVIQEPPSLPLSRPELDRVHELPYERAWHSMYDAFGGVPAFSEVKFSLVSSRGCFGGCSFCSITLHQGKAISSRSRESLLREAAILAGMPDFKGYIHDLGGPTADFRASACRKTDESGSCPDRLCLSPEPCPNLQVDHGEYLGILRAIRRLPGVKKVFIRSGIRFDYLTLDRDETFFRELVEHHISGQLKVAPEHVSETVLRLMGKPGNAAYAVFSKRYAELNREVGLKQYLVPYFISAHPGAGLREAVELALYLRDAGFVPDQAQDFYPTPGTLATAMYWTGMDPTTGDAVHVARGERERAMQRALLQFNKPENRELVHEALILAGRRDLIGSGPKCLVRY